MAAPAAAKAAATPIARGGHEFTGTLGRVDFVRLGDGESTRSSGNVSCGRSRRAAGTARHDGEVLIDAACLEAHVAHRAIGATGNDLPGGELELQLRAVTGRHKAARLRGDDLLRAGLVPLDEHAAERAPVGGDLVGRQRIAILH